MNRSNRKNRSKQGNHLQMLFTNIKKFNQRIKSRLTWKSVAKNALICVCSFVLAGFICLLIQTKSPLRDVFTNGRISILKERPAHITKDIIVDMSSMCAPGGIMNLTRALITDISKKRPNWRLLVLVSKGQKHVYNLPKADNIKLIEIECFPLNFIIAEHFFKLKSFGIFHDKLTQLLYYDRIFCDRNCDLLWNPVGFSCYCNFVNIPKISTIHDTACFDIFPKFLGGDTWILESKMCQENSVHFSKKIITVSEFSRKRIEKNFPEAEDLVKVIPIRLGTRVYSSDKIDKVKKILDKYGLKSQKYFIFCSSWWRNKNHVNLMKAFNKFAQKNSEIKLILVGKHPDMFESRPIKDFCSDRLIISGFVPDEDLGILLKNALAFVHPSVYEGFGMPIIEAMANGIPVACSNVASLPEVAGSAALFFDPFDTDSITRAMHRLVNDPQLRNHLIQKGYQQAKKYSDRDAMVDEYIRVMENVMHENDLRKARKELK